MDIYLLLQSFITAFMLLLAIVVVLALTCIAFGLLVKFMGPLDAIILIWMFIFLALATTLFYGNGGHF